MMMTLMALLMLMLVGFTSALYSYPGTQIDCNRDDDDDLIDGFADHINACRCHDSILLAAGIYIATQTSG